MAKLLVSFKNINEAVLDPGVKWKDIFKHFICSFIWSIIVLEGF